MRRVDTLLPPDASPKLSPRRAAGRTRASTADTAATAAAAAGSEVAGTAGGDDDDDDDDDDMFEEVSATLKPGYEERFVDPDEGWERPPPEAMRPAAEASSMSPPSVSPAPPAASSSSLRQSVMQPAAEGPRRGLGVGRPCGAARRDGSLCDQRVAPGASCRFHGILVERDANGVPRNPTGVYAVVLQARASANARPVAGAASGGGDVLSGPADVLTDASPNAAECAGSADGPSSGARQQDSKRARSVDPLPPYSAAPLPEQRPAKQQQTAKQRLLARINRRNR